MQGRGRIAKGSAIGTKLSDDDLFRRSMGKRGTLDRSTISRSKQKNQLSNVGVKPTRGLVEIEEK